MVDHKRNGDIREELGTTDMNTAINSCVQRKATRNKWTPNGTRCQAQWRNNLNSVTGVVFYSNGSCRGRTRDFPNSKSER